MNAVPKYLSYVLLWILTCQSMPTAASISPLFNFDLAAIKRSLLNPRESFSNLSMKKKLALGGAVGLTFLLTAALAYKKFMSNQTAEPTPLASSVQYQNEVDIDRMQTETLQKYSHFLGATSEKALNKRIHEDLILIAPIRVGNEMPSCKSHLLVGVIDGYHGDYAAKELRRLLPELLTEYLAAGNPPAKALHDALVEADNRYNNEFITDAENRRSRLDWTPFYGEYGSSGATIVAALFINNTVVIATLGDCSAVLAYDKQNLSKSADSIIQLTPQHRPDNLAEYKRIREGGARAELNTYGVPVIAPTPHAITRSFGSMALKEKYRQHFPQMLATTPLVVLAEPEITGPIELTHDMQYLVLVSDGITDFIVPKSTLDSMLVREKPFKTETGESLGIGPITKMSMLATQQTINNKISQIIDSISAENGSPQNIADELVRFTLHNQKDASEKDTLGKDDASALVIDIQAWRAYLRECLTEVY